MLSGCDEDDDLEACCYDDIVVIPERVYEFTVFDVSVYMLFLELVLLLSELVLETVLGAEFDDVAMIVVALPADSLAELVEIDWATSHVKFDCRNLYVSKLFLSIP